MLGKERPAADSALLWSLQHCGDAALEAIAKRAESRLQASTEEWESVWGRVRELARWTDADLVDPTVEGSTWLTLWPAPVRADGVHVRADARLLVAPRGVLLQPGDVRGLVSSVDLGRDLDGTTRGLFVTRLPGDCLLLSEDQRREWGRAMHASGRVLVVLEPDSEAPQRGRKKRS